MTRRISRLERSQFVYSIRLSQWVPDPALRLDNATSLKTQLAEPEPIEAPEELEEEPIEAPEEEVNLAEDEIDGVVDVVSALTCSEHPHYSGKRLGAKAKQCETCMAVYRAVQASGFREKRNRK